MKALAERVLVFDGAMGTQIMALELDDAAFGGPQYHGCNEVLVLSRPDVVAGIHSAFLEAGADVLETDSFTASRLKLDDYGLGEKTVEINRRAAEIARDCAGRFAPPAHSATASRAISAARRLIAKA